MIILPLLIVMVVVALPLAGVLVGAIVSVLFTVAGSLISSARLAREKESALVLPAPAGLRLKMA